MQEGKKLFSKASNRKATGGFNRMAKMRAEQEAKDTAQAKQKKETATVAPPDTVVKSAPRKIFGKH